MLHLINQTTLQTTYPHFNDFCVLETFYTTLG